MIKLWSDQESKYFSYINELLVKDLTLAYGKNTFWGNETINPEMNTKYL